MKIEICKNYDEMSVFAAKEIAEKINAASKLTLGLATGATPVGMYKNLIAMNKEGKVDFSGVTTFNLDEYYPIEKDDPQSYYYFMYENLFSHININSENVHVPDGKAADAAAYGGEYDRMIQEAGGIDIQVLGSGVNGHIGFNEPDDSLVLGTHKTSLTQNTIEVNSRFFDDISLVPTEAITMGIKTIMDARKIIILINGASKAPIIDAMTSGVISTQIPATLLQMHSDVLLVTDEETISKTERFRK